MTHKRNNFPHFLHLAMPKIRHSDINELPSVVPYHQTVGVLPPTGKLVAQSTAARLHAADGRTIHRYHRYTCFLSPPSARVPPGADVRGVSHASGLPLTPRCSSFPIRRRFYGALIRSGEVEPSGDYGLERRRTPLPIPAVLSFPGLPLQGYGPVGVSQPLAGPFQFSQPRPAGIPPLSHASRIQRSGRGTPILQNMR